MQQFWKIAGAGVAIVGAVLVIGVVLKDQTGAVNILNALGTNSNTLIGTLEKAG